MSKMIETRVEIINGEKCVVKIYAPSREEWSLLNATKSRYQKLCSGAQFLAKDSGQIKE